MKYLEGKQLPVDEGEFNSECGVGKREHSQLSRLPLTTSLNVQNFPSKGYSITLEDLYTNILNYVSTASLSGWDDLGRTIGALKGSSKLRWANPLEVKNTVEKVFTEKFGDKSAAKAKAAAVSLLCVHDYHLFILKLWAGDQIKERDCSFIKFRCRSFIRRSG